MPTTATPRVPQAAAFPLTRLLACELGVQQGPRGFTLGAAPRPRARHGPAGDGHTGLEARRRATSRFGLPEAARVGRGDAAGREGCWRHRCASGRAESPPWSTRRASRCIAATAGPRRLTRLRCHRAGAQKVWRGVRVPSGAEEEGGWPQRGYHGEKGVWGPWAPRITQPPAQVEGHAPVGPATGTRMA
jgi:hypothetical protein